MFPNPLDAADQVEALRPGDFEFMRSISGQPYVSLAFATKRKRLVGPWLSIIFMRATPEMVLSPSSGRGSPGFRFLELSF